MGRLDTELQGQIDKITVSSSNLAPGASPKMAESREVLVSLELVSTDEDII